MTSISDSDALWYDDGGGLGFRPRKRKSERGGEKDPDDLRKT